MVKKLLIPLILLISCIVIVPHLTKKQSTKINPTTEKRVQVLTQQLTPEERVGQLFIWGIDDVTLSTKSADLITSTHPAGVLLTGTFTTDQVKKLADQIKQLPTKIPLFIAIDEEGGTVRHITDDPFDGGRTLGMESDDRFCTTIASRSALLMHAGINTNFGIIADVGWNDAYGYIYPRTYADAPEDVAKRVHEAIYCAGNSITVVKHFPGHGSTEKNSHRTVPAISKNQQTWMKEDGMPFFQAIKDGVDMIMIGHLIYSQIATEPASLSKPFHDMLTNANYQGITITDDLGMLEQNGYPLKTSLLQAITAGNNLLLVSTTVDDPKQVYETLLREATPSSVLMDHIMRATEKTITLKSIRL